MDKKIVFIAFMLLSACSYASSSYFKVYLNMIIPIKIELVQSLSFPPYFTGKNASIKTEYSNGRASVFKASGEPNKSFIASINENEIKMYLGGINRTSKEEIIVSDFVLGGDVNDNGMGNFGSNGKVNNIRIGATAEIKSTNRSGSYYGMATLRITYL